MTTQFQDRTEAGRLLAAKLEAKYGNRTDVVVLALPRGGVPVAFEVARALRAPLDVFVVRKLGVPGREELAMGAIASGGVRVLNTGVIDSLGVPDADIDDVTTRETAELHRREHAYRDHRPPAEIAGRTVLLIDDGIATGSTMRAALAALRHKHPARLVVATPTVGRETALSLAGEADELVAVMTPDVFDAVGQFYAVFQQTTDDEVRDLLATAHDSAN